MGKTLRSGSKQDWGIQREDGKLLEIEIQVGCLQRIADAVEKMAHNHDDLLQDIYLLRRTNESHKVTIDKLFRQVNTYKGIIKKMKGV